MLDDDGADRRVREQPQELPALTVQTRANLAAGFNDVELPLGGVL